MAHIEKSELESTEILPFLSVWALAWLDNPDQVVSIPDEAQQFINWAKDRDLDVDISTLPEEDQRFIRGIFAIAAPGFLYPGE